MTTISPMITVFTPTYNRAHTLHRVFMSLQNQSIKNFEWLVIDDGSTDNTESLIEEFKEKANFPIVYIKQENQHKFLTIYKAAQLAGGEFFVSIDSDDSFESDALEKMLLYWENAPKDTVFVSVLCKDEKGKVIGDRFPKSGLSTTIFDLRYKYKVKGDKWGMTKTKILKEIFTKSKINLGNLRNKGFIPEGVYQFYYDTLGMHFCINDPLRTYFRDFTDDESLANLYYNNKNAFGLAENYKMFINIYADKKWKYPKVLFRNLIGYLVYSAKNNCKVNNVVVGVDDAFLKYLSFFIYLFKPMLKKVEN